MLPQRYYCPISRGILAPVPSLLGRLNIVAECRAAKLGLWSCPPFLFIVMGAVDISAMLASWLLAGRYVDEPRLAALVVIAVSAGIFVIGNLVIQGFSQIAEANRVKSEFIAIVSHQLRSPLSIFKWTLDLLAPAPDGTDAARHLTTLRDSTERMVQLVNMLLEVSRLEGGRLLIRREPVRLEVLTAEVLRGFEGFARASGVALDYAAPSGLPPVRGDREKVEMVIQNLLDNAVRYSAGRGRVQIRIAPAGDGMVEWRVRDQGPGIPKAEQHSVFQKFFRANTTTRHQIPGTGLGLYIASAVVTALGGEIGFASEEGKGSTFWFRLPIYDQTEAGI